MMHGGDTALKLAGVKLRAMLLHLLVCIAIAAIAGVLIFELYPQHMLFATGGDRVVVALVLVDLVLGPMLTLIVYRPGKKGLKFDYAMIGLLQVCALCYGLWTLYVARPAFIVFAETRFELVQANDLREEELLAAGWRYPAFGPEWVHVRRADDQSRHAQIVLEAMAGRDYAVRPEFYEPLARASQQIRSAGRPIGELRLLNRERDMEISRWFEKQHLNEHDTRFVPLKVRGRDMAVIVGHADGRVLGIAPFAPW